MSARDWQAFDAEVRARVQDFAVELLGQLSSKAGHEWRWGRKGSLSVVVSGAKAGMWFDHETGEGGGFVDLVGRTLGMARRDALDWTAERIGMGMRHRPVQPRRSMPTPAATAPVPPLPHPDAADASRTEHNTDPDVSRAAEAAARATGIWSSARPAPAEHRYLIAKQATPLSLRMDPRGQLVVPLQDVEGKLHSLETIAPDGAKRFLAGGAKG